MTLGADCSRFGGGAQSFAFKQELRGRILLHKSNPERHPWRPLYNATADPYVCAECGAEAIKMKRCSGCQTVAYCNRICQQRHWKQHKAFCDPDACLVFVGRSPLHLDVINKQAPVPANISRRVSCTNQKTNIGKKCRRQEQFAATLASSPED